MIRTDTHEASEWVVQISIRRIQPSSTLISGAAWTPSKIGTPASSSLSASLRDCLELGVPIRLPTSLRHLGYELRPSILLDHGSLAGTVLSMAVHIQRRQLGGMPESILHRLGLHPCQTAPGGVSVPEVMPGYCGKPQGLAGGLYVARCRVVQINRSVGPNSEHEIVRPREPSSRSSSTQYRNFHCPFSCFGSGNCPLPLRAMSRHPPFVNGPLD